MNLDFISALCEEFAWAIGPVVPPEFLTPQDCWDPIIKVFGKNLDSRTLAGATGQQISDLRAAFAQSFECEEITEAHLRFAIAAVLRRWPVPPAPADPRIIGFWKGLGGDYGLINEFRSDGTLIQHVGNRPSRPSAFRIEGDYIITSLVQPDGRIFEQKKQYAISGDTLTFFYSPGKKIHFQRTKAA